MMQQHQQSDDEMMLRHRKGSESIAEISTNGLSTQRLHRCQHRRSFSASRLEDVHSNENRVRKSQPDNPIHKPRDSIFSSRNSQLQNFTGFVNWAFLILTLGGIRLFLENFIKYGVRVDPTQWLIILTKRNEAGFDYHSPILISYVIIPILSCFCFEIAMSKNAISSKIGLYLQIMNLLSIVLTPLFVIHVYGATFSLIGSACVCFVYCIVFLKLWSYVHVNVWCRRAAAVASTGCFSCPLEPSHYLPSHSSTSSQHSSASNGKASGGTSAHATANENQESDTVDHHLDYQYHQHLHHQHRRSKSKSILDSCSKSKQLFQQQQQSCENNKETNLNRDDEMPAVVDDTDAIKNHDHSPPNGTVHVTTATSTTTTQPQIQLVAYPDNLNVRDLAYFMVVPTLCYELNFPRTSRIRKRFLIKRVFEVCIGLNLMICLIQQYMVPCVKNSLIPFSNMDVAKAAERLLKLAIPNHLIWLCGFYLLFHSFLNVLGELFYFADRNFYCDWWNANNVNVFWRTWNMPVHRWALRHLYLPIIELGYDRNVAVFVVFFLSAFFHEYLLSAPLKTFKVWAFGAMMSQIPLTFASSLFEQRLGPKWGNVIVWASIIVGQPLCIMIYYHDYVITNYGKELLDAYAHV